MGLNVIKGYIVTVLLKDDMFTLFCKDYEDYSDKTIFLNCILDDEDEINFIKVNTTNTVAIYFKHVYEED